MAKQGVIRVNPDRTLVEVDTPEGIEWGPETWPGSEDDSMLILSDEDAPGEPSYVVILDGYGNLKPHTMYRLTEVPTSMEEAELSEEDVDDEDDEEEEAETKPS